MRFPYKFTMVVALLIALAGLSCASKSESYPAQPVAAQLTVDQANTLAQQYLDQHAVASPRALIIEQEQPDGWWLYYQTPFDPSARPPKLSYLIQVHNDGTV